MNDLGIFSVEDANLIYSAYRRLVDSGMLSANGTANRQYFPGGIPNDFAPISFRNDSAYTIPPYGFMQVIGATEPDPKSKNYILVKRPNETPAIQGEYLINGPDEVLTNGFGMAQRGPVYRVQCVAGSASIAAGVRIGPADGVFTGNLGCGYFCYGPDDIGTDVWRVSRNDSSIFAKTKVGGIAADGFANVIAQKPKAAADYWEADTVEYVAYSRSVAILADKLVELIPNNGRWCAFEVCP